MYRRMLFLFGTILCLLTGCVAPAPNNPANTQTTTQQKVTDSGFICPEPSPRLEVTSKELNLYAWTEYIPQDIIDCFGMIYNVKVNMDNYSSAEEMYAKLSNGAALYDVTQPTDNFFQPVIRNGLAEKLDKSRLVNLKNIAPQFLSHPADPQNDYIVPYEAWTTGIIYDPAKVKTPPTAWADLWSNEYAGHMVFINEQRSIIGFTLVVEGHEFNTTDPAVLESIKPKLQALVHGVKLFDSDSPKSAMIAGDADLGVMWSGEAMLAKREKPSLEYVFPKEGTIIGQDGYIIVKDAPHLDAAYAWLSYSLQGDTFWLMLRDYPYTNPNQAALDYAKEHQPELYKEYADSPITNIPADVVKNGFRSLDVGEALPIYDRLWTEAQGN
ncbi:MAG: spermidine/putrescine ABC transporter substrate-binding protein [Caldilineaceae bacterium]